MSNNNPNKKYRNIKDIYSLSTNILIRRGTIFEFFDENIYKEQIAFPTISTAHYASEAAVSNKEWFEEVVEERIKVEIEGKYCVNWRHNESYYSLQFRASKDFPNEKMEQIKNKIEEIINTDNNTGCNTGLMSQSDMYQLGYKDGVKYGNLDKKYSQSELDAAIADAFCSARLTNGKLTGMKYSGLKDYLNTLNK